MNRPFARLPLRSIVMMPSDKRLKWLLMVAIAVAFGLIAYLSALEIQSSRLQAHYLAHIGHKISFSLAKGANPDIRFPSSGPYDMRFGYTRLPEFDKRLAARGFVITAQAQSSSMMRTLGKQGLFLPYPEKDQAGLQLFDATGDLLFSARYPALVYADFDAIPPVIVHTLRFIEDRYLLDANEPYRNPAIDWGRFSRALTGQAMRFVNPHQPTLGGSTLATQIEKFRHSPNGRTATPAEKLRQIATASVRAYLEGENTLPVRKQIVVDYLNSVPLAAQPGTGEIEGLGDGLAAWYGRDFDDINRLLAPTSLQSPPGASAASARRALAAQALAFKQVLSLIVAQRAPSYYLTRAHSELERLTDSYLRVLAANGVISPPLRDAALAEHLQLRYRASARAATPFVTRKAATLLRTQLMSVLGIDSVYALDRLDLTARSTLNYGVEQALTGQLTRVGTEEGARAAGLYGFDMLRPGDDPSKIAYSFTLFERRNGQDVLRVQTDSVNQPFNLSQGARLNLGSTAKLRTLITYLQIITALHARYAPLSHAELQRIPVDPSDVLTRWALGYLMSTTNHSLPAMLNAAVERKYSASVGETFYTGGGAQTFTNFKPTENGQFWSVHEAFEHSINLIFVRLMRDIVRYEMIQTAGPSTKWLDEPAIRQRYLMRFVDRESLVYMHRFYKKYQGKTPDAALDTLIAGMRKSPAKIATALRSVAPDAPRAWFDARMRAALKNTRFAASIDARDLDKLYTKYGIDKFNLNDRGYISRVHPLELWTLNYLYAHPNASESELQQASTNARVTAYTWLFKTRYRATQDRKIRQMVALQAYAEIAKSWRALGYPFATLTPSFAAAIGASGDRPAALAQLIGIIANEGALLPAHSLSTLEFGANTPYETHFHYAPRAGQTVLAPEIAQVVHHLLRDVVTAGTARRLAEGLPLSDGRAVEVYGKTGTGDQRFNVYARGARLIQSRKVNRTATFVFVIDNRFFGTITAHVREPYAARYTYTSALAVQLLKSLGPTLEPLFDTGPDRLIQARQAPLPPERDQPPTPPSPS